MFVSTGGASVQKLGLNGILDPRNTTFSLGYNASVSLWTECMSTFL